MDIASTTTTRFINPVNAQSGLAASGGQNRDSAVASASAERKMKDAIAAREVVKQLPDRKTTERQIKLKKAQMLRERLKMLRQMMAFLSSKSTKALAAEIKQIASQLAALGDGSGGPSSGLNRGTTGAAQSGGQQDASSNQTASAPLAAATGGTDTEPTSGDTTAPVTPSTANASDAPPNRQAHGSEDRQLNDTVEEAKNLLRSVIAALKRKRQQDKAMHPALIGATLPGYPVTFRHGAADQSVISFNA